MAIDLRRCVAPSLLGATLLRRRSAFACIALGQLLIVPTEGYLEACSGPVAMRQVQWVQIAPIKLRGGLAGRPVEFIDLRDQTEAALREAGTVWTLCEEEWSVEGVFANRPLTAIHIANPFNGRA